MTEKQFKTWDQYAEEGARPPFQLKVSEEETVEVQMPTGAALVRFASSYRDGDMQAMLYAMCGDAWPRIEELISKAPYKAMENLVTDMMLHFELAEEHELVAPGGGKRYERDPRKIRALLRQGWRPAGEARSRP